MTTVYLQEVPGQRLNAGIRRAFNGDFSALPVNPTFDDFWALHNVIDGYRTAEESGYGDLSGLGGFANRKTQEYWETQRWTGSALDLWLTLFFNCRASRHSDSPPGELEWRTLYQALRERLQALAPGEIQLVLEGRQAARATNDDFYRVIAKIPPGKVATYGQVAGWAGSPGAAQAVGNALRNRPADRPLPWQRVVNGDGKRGVLSTSAPTNQRKLLEDEGISFEPQGFIRLDRFGWGGPASVEAQSILDASFEELGDVASTLSTDLQALDDPTLFRLYADVMQELRHRGLSQGMNNPSADYAEKLVAKALHAEVMPPSNTGFDLRGPGDIRYEVKSRRMNSARISRQLSALRNLDARQFDFLVGVLFNEDFTVYRAAIIPWELVRDHAVYREHTNAWVFHLRDSVWDLPGVKELFLECGT